MATGGGTGRGKILAHSSAKGAASAVVPASRDDVDPASESEPAKYTPASKPEPAAVGAPMLKPQAHASALATAAMIARRFTETSAREGAHARQRSPARRAPGSP